MESNFRRVGSCKEMPPVTMREVCAQPSEVTVREADTPHVK